MIATISRRDYFALMIFMTNMSEGIWPDNASAEFSSTNAVRLAQILENACRRQEQHNEDHITEPLPGDLPYDG